MQTLHWRAVRRKCIVVRLGSSGAKMMFTETERTQALKVKLQRFFDSHIFPNHQRYVKEVSANRRNGEPFKHVQLIEELKPHARAAGLWNLFLPQSERAPNGLSNLEYAPLCEVMGRVGWSSEVFNCSAPDTGNMEILERYATEDIKARFLVPLLKGEIRSAFCMTEPAVASSDATNIETKIARDGDHYVITGRKWWSSGVGDPRCKIAILMGK